jgi:hypothetical protein
MSQLFYPRIELRFTKNYSPSDSTQVPAGGATYAVYRQGATASASASIPHNWVVQVSVYDTGAIQVGDTVMWSRDVNHQFYVSDLDPEREWVELTNSGTSMTAHPGDRLIPLGSPPTLYSDSAGTTALASNTVTLDEEGLGAFFCGERYADAILTGAGDPRVFADAPGDVVRNLPWVNVRDYPSFQDAHDALPESGGTIFVPAGQYDKDSAPAFTGLVITKALAVIGEGNGQASALSVLNHNAVVGSVPAKDRDAIWIRTRGGCLLRDLVINGPRDPNQPEEPTPISGRGRGVRWYVPSDPDNPASARLAGVTLANVTVWGSSNWAFEFVCDGHSDSYVSKLEMIGCTAYGAASGGSLHLGGAGSNNNWFERCEFNGPGEGLYFNVAGCRVTRDSDVVTNTDSAPFARVQVGDEVVGMGITVGDPDDGTAEPTTVTDVSSNEITLSRPAIQSSWTPTQPLMGTTLGFYRPSTPNPQVPSELPRGHVHLLRTSVSRFHHCSFQGPGASPALSTDLISNDLELRDCYREADGALSVASFVVNGMSNLLIDGLFHQAHADTSLLLKTGPAGVTMGRISNAQLVTADPTGTDVIHLSNSGDELVVDHSNEQSSLTGLRRGLVVAGPGAVILAAQLDDGELSFPNGSDEVFIFGGSDPVTSIVALRPKQRVTLLFTGSAQLVQAEGGNLVLNGGYSGGANRTITLICDGQNWFEVARSPNVQP